MTRTVAVIGAGLAGLACARALAERGCAVTVIDKGRRPGGRASSRCDDAGRGFDHGAQYFTARGAWLARQVEGWARAGVVGRWSPRVQRRSGLAVAPTEPRWVGTPDMGALARHLAWGLDVRSGDRVVSVARVGPTWALAIEGPTGAAPPVHAAALVVAIPAAQCTTLLASVSALAGAAGAVVQAPCWAVMVGVRGAPISVDVFEDRDGVVAWAAREASKPGRPDHDHDGLQLWTLHASTAWSEAHLDASAAQVCAALTAAFVDRCPRGTVAVAVARAHRWRYARGQTTAAPAGAWFDRPIDLAVCGDWLVGARVEAAFTSGLAAAAGLLDGFGAAGSPT